jgi:ring-1,2-phenylacetyl-CoA epoxidase subunit PaaC
MIIGQRNAEWCGHGPILEQDIALTNITLDLIGEARGLYQYAASLQGNNATEDSMAFLRDARAYKNLLLTEQPNNDWGFTIVRQFLFDCFHYYTLQALCSSKDEQLKAIAEKSLKEVTYHIKWSSEWVIRLGDGTTTSQEKVQSAINTLWDYTHEMFIPSQAEQALTELGLAPDLEPIKANWNKRVTEILEQATIQIPEQTFAQKGGKQGIHTEYLGYILTDMQYLQRSYPGLDW